MLYELRSALLAPLIVPQGLWVRSRIPRLEEPPGDRQGTAGNGPVLRLLILGDSAAAGVGAPHQDDALLGQLLRRLTPGYTVSWDLQATTGHRSEDALERLRGLDSGSYDVAVTSLGVNDVTGMTRRGLFRENQARLRQVLRNDFGVRRILVSGLPPMHGFPALPQPLRWHLGARASQLNDDLRQDVANDESAEFVDVRFTEDQSLMSADGFHPGPDVYAVWADLLVQAINRDAEAAVSRL